MPAPKLIKLWAASKWENEMKPNPRAAIAYISWRLISGKPASAVYDFEQRKYIIIDGKVTSHNVDVYDYDQGCQVNGIGNGRSFEIFHRGDSSQINLIINGTEFEGYDHGQSCHFSGEVAGDAIKVFDQATGIAHGYSL